VWSYVSPESDADFYGKQSGLKYEKEPLFTHPTPDDAMSTYREVGVWDTDGRKFRTYAKENLNGKAMYVLAAAIDRARQSGEEGNE
jgi:hypothetical protein